MNTDRIYKELMLDNYIKKIKLIRNSWNSNPSIEGITPNPFIDIVGDKNRKYTEMMEYIDSTVYKMIDHIIIELLKEYKIPVEFYDLRKADAISYYMYEKKDNQGYIDQLGNKVLAFSTMVDPDFLFVFKKYGLSQQLPQNTKNDLLKKLGLRKVIYISYVEDNAFSEIINHNDNKDDPSRGTGVFSLKQFIEKYFGEEEYAKFKVNADVFTKNVKDYLGITIVRALKPNELLSFKRYIINQLESINAYVLGLPESLGNRQKEILDNHYFNEKKYELLIGNSDFAQSFMTAEWLYYSLSDAGKIDLTAISMGYFKAIEQFLFRFISLHTFEKDGVSRKIFLVKEGLVELTDTLVNDREKAKRITIGGLTGFFGYYKADQNEYIERNRDLLSKSINNQTYRIIINVLNGISGLRNGYFHKDNLDNWDVVTKARNTSLLVFYLVLGAYTMTEEDKIALGLICRKERDDFYKLCEYINNKAEEAPYLSFSIFYLDERQSEDEIVFPYRDNNVEHDEYGELIYSGACFRMLENNKILKISKENAPKEIWEGSLSISKSVPLKFNISGRQKLIYKDGKFIAE